MQIFLLFPHVEQKRMEREPLRSQHAIYGTVGVPTTIRYIESLSVLLISSEDILFNN